MQLPTPTNHHVASQQAEWIKMELRHARIGYDEAVALLLPRLAIMQKRMDEIAKEHGRKPQKIHIGHYLRF